MTMQALTDTAPVPVEELTVQAERFAALYAQCGNASTAYRKAYNVAATTLPNTVHRKAHQLKHTPAVARRIHELRNALAEQFVVSAAALKLRQYEVASAAPLTHVRIYACRHCWSPDHAYAWRGAAEFAKALDAYGEAKGTGQRPSAAGGFSFDPFASPCPTCPECMGAGKPVVYLPDTIKLEGAAAASYAGASIDKYGVITVEQHDAQDAAFELHRMIPGAIAPARTESKSLTVHVEPLRDMTPQQVVEFMQQQRLLT